MDNPNERRNYRRMTFNQAGADYRLVDFTLMAESRARGSKLLRDVSLGGISFDSDDHLPADSLVQLTLRLGDTLNIGDICGRIVRIRKTDTHKYEIGVRFSWWGKEEDKMKLVNVLKKTSDREIPAQ
ncbi:MAG: PilZ domain-containing protein [Candidatus Omnitrophica bacterium]|jgi:PilZ domain.|nr:PilZ domain-containing protein [Candidatus Omnitrophota bacterium]